MLKNKTQLKFVRKSFFAILYGLMSAIGINVFLSHAHSYSIGVPGIAQLLQAIFANFGISVSISFLMIIMNIPLFLFALKAFGFNYIVFSLMAVASNIFFLQIIPQVTVVTNDLTNTLVGAAIIGAGIGGFVVCGSTGEAAALSKEEQLACLRYRGCDEIQGYYFSRPLPPAQFEQFVRARMGAPVQA